MKSVAVVLAAGDSGRLKQPKQLVMWKGENLLRRTARLACCVADETMIILGSQYDTMRQALTDAGARIVRNTRWQDGMGTSLALAGASLPRQTDAMFLLFCDQPLIRLTDLQTMLAIFTAETPDIVIASHGDTLSPPAIIAATLFTHLGALRGDTGLRAIIRDTDSIRLRRFECPNAAFDIDTPADLERLKTLAKHD